MHFGVIYHIRASALTTADRRPPSWNRITDSTHAPPVGNGIGEPHCFCLHSIERFPAIYFFIAEVNIRFIHMQPYLGSIFQMYFIIKYNVFNKYIINVTTTEINTCKTIFEFGQREVISFFMLVINKGEHFIIYSK
jgi:hypothetical protein